VTVTLDALPGQTFTGSVQGISGVGSNVGRLFSVRIGLNGSLSEVRPGMFARGVVQVRSVSGATVVPTTAIVRKNDKDTVFLATGDKAKAVIVTRGIAQGDVVQVTGVHPGDPVIVQGQSDLDDGVKIQVDTKAAG